MMGQDETGVLGRLRALRRELIDPRIDTHRGRIVKTTGDGMLVEFPSVVEAVTCAVAVQRAMAERNSATPEDQRMVFRIGINLGDIIVEEDDIFGDGVNIAARLEAMAEPGGICISRTVLTQIYGKLHLSTEYLGEQALKNIAQPVHVFRVLAEAESVLAPTALSVHEKPSIAVLRFENMSGEPEQEYFADGMVEEIITALSRIRWLFVIARASSFNFKGQAVDVKQVGRELGVRYILAGSVRKAGSRVRITAELIEAKTGAHLWADRFDGSLDDVFDLQDRIAISVAGIIEPTLQAAEIHRSGERSTTDPTTYDLYLLALAHAYSWEKDGALQALELLMRAIHRDPRYGLALVQAAVRHHDLHVNGWTDDLETARTEGVDLARRALDASGDDPHVLSNAGYVLAYFGEDLNAAIGLVDRALELNPSDARAWQRSGWLKLWAGNTTVAIQNFETSLRLNPRERRANALQGIGVAKFFARRFDEARATLLQSLQEKPNWVPSYRFLAACCAHMGRLDEARDTVARMRPLTGVLVPSATHWRNLEQRELYLSGLRLAIQHTK
jgi:TolB-like protein/Tfp pilus assembly protein PilF